MQWRSYIPFTLTCLLLAALLYLLHVPVVYESIPGFVLLSGLIYTPFRQLWMKGWTAIGHALGYVNSKILLSVLYLFFITPYSFLFRRKSASLYRTKKSPEQRSSFVQRHHAVTKSDFEKSW